MIEKLSLNAYFMYVKDIEYILASIELLSGFEVNPKIREVYDEAFVEQQKNEYPLLFELYDHIGKGFGIEILEFMMSFDVTDFTLEKYFEYIMSLSKTEFLSIFLQKPLDEIEKALCSDGEQLTFYQKYKDELQSYFAVEILFQKTEWLIQTYYEFVVALRTEKAVKFLEKHDIEIQKWKTKLKEGLTTEEPLLYSEHIMGKTFHNRGPYEKFFFMPSIFMPLTCVRWFEDNQILIFDAVRFGQKDNTMISDALKMMSDKTRYKILVILKEKKSLNGIEIAEYMNLATSTVSHHMSQLRSSGLVHEEPAGNTKYYSLNTHCIKNCIETLEKTFL
ncbi:MAG: winged helix-turn-helix transcriptional regulator [Agathobacter sp.]|nr:winged helix-turn-helix transcriptional regulator [Agathobacter sp.]